MPPPWDTMDGPSWIVWMIRMHANSVLAKRAVPNPIAHCSLGSLYCKQGTRDIVLNTTTLSLAGLGTLTHPTLTILVEAGRGMLLMQVRTIAGDSEPITALCFTRDGGSVYAASRSLTTKRWDVATGAELRSWKPHDAPVADMAVDGSGCLLATASADRSARVWDVDKVRQAPTPVPGMRFMRR